MNGAERTGANENREWRWERERKWTQKRECNRDNEQRRERKGERLGGKRWCFCFYIKCWMWINFGMRVFTLADAVGRLRPHLFIRLTTQTNKYYQLSCIHGPATAAAKTVKLWQRSSYSPFLWQRTRIDGCSWTLCIVFMPYCMSCHFVSVACLHAIIEFGFGNEFSSVESLECKSSSAIKGNLNWCTIKYH